MANPSAAQQRMYELARAEVGQLEVQGPKSNPRISEYIATVGGRLEDSKFAWCGAFMAWCASKAGLPFKKSGLARAWLRWGANVPISEAREGDVVVLWRGSKDALTGHVGFFVRWLPGGRFLLYGGNTGNRVAEGSFPRGRVLAIRRALAT